MFRAGSFAVFTDLLTGWVLAPGRRTVTAMITLPDPAGGRAHDAYHRFLRDGAWNISGLWRLLATHAVTSFASTGVASLDCDNTLFHKRILGRFAWPPWRRESGSIFGSADARSPVPGPSATPCVPPASGSSTRSA
ncbi:MAG: transposase [Dermatophilaceae bacterium]